ncbi:hypothetical protein EDD15DRAFT_113464 [Pisolithus albus]|nr:hypothetical protein EDD15DRAFT_113464 [Pisolithus albus]
MHLRTSTCRARYASLRNTCYETIIPVVFNLRITLSRLFRWDSIRPSVIPTPDANVCISTSCARGYNPTMYGQASERVVTCARYRKVSPLSKLSSSHRETTSSRDRCLFRLCVLIGGFKKRPCAPHDTLQASSHPRGGRPSGLHDEIEMILLCSTVSVEEEDTACAIIYT